MVTKKEFTFLSRNGKDNCHAISWTPEDGKIKAVFQIIHGMREHIDRYDDFATFLANNGILVVGSDHLGHGKTAPTEKDFGYFGEGDIPTILVRDAHRLKKIIQEQNPGIPYFILGHSMGSFVLRKYLSLYRKGIDGAILIGTGSSPGFLTRFGIILSSILNVFQGARHKSNLLEKIAFGSYNKKIPTVVTSSDWLTEDSEAIKTYRQDPYCGFIFTVNGFNGLFKLYNYVCKPKYLTGIKKDIPILIMSGKQDPVGDYGKGPTKVYEQYKKANMTDVELILHDDMRHEVLFSCRKQDVYDYMLNWVITHTK